MENNCFGSFCEKHISCCRPMACGWKTALQWRCARLCVMCRRIALLRVLAWPQVNHQHPFLNPTPAAHAKPSDHSIPFWLTCKLTDMSQHLRTHTHTLLPNTGPCCLLITLMSSFCYILVYSRRYYHHHQWCQHRRIISSAHTWPDKRVNQQAQVSDTNEDFLECHSSTTRQ